MRHFSSPKLKNHQLNDFYCKNCNTNQWEISTISDLDDNGVWTYKIEIEGLWCLNCEKECKRSDIYTKQERRNEKLDFLIDKS